jgi:2-haloalkanoic acid dehalogenase type II
MNSDNRSLAQPESRQQPGFLDIRAAMPQPFDIITFDCYGTLIDWEAGIIGAFQSEAAKDEVELRSDQIIEAYAAEEAVVESGSYLSYHEVLGATALRAAARLGWDLSEKRAEFLAASLPEWQPFPDTNPALERLAQRYRLGILSNIDDDLLAATRKQFNVDFDLIVTAQQIGSYKPRLAHFKEAVVRAGDRRLLHAAQSYFHDVVPACMLDIPVVWVNRKDSSIPPGRPMPTHEVSTLTDLANLLAA